MSSARRWQRARRISQALFLLLFLYLLVATTRRGSTPLAGDLFLRFDPLAAFAAQLGGHALLPRLWPALLTIGLAFVLGRSWCGWICPLGTTLDYITPRNQRRQADEPPKQWRRSKYLVLFAILGMAVFSSLTLMVLDPITVLSRTMITAVLPGLNYVTTTAETTLYPIGPLQGPLDVFEKAVRGTILPASQPLYQLNVLLALAFGGILLLNWVAPRFWCRYLCPLGALLALPARFAIWRPRASDECNRCGACARECRTGAISSKNGFEVDARECVMCMDCQVECPQQAISISRGMMASAEPARVYDPNRRQALMALGAGVAGIALMRSEPATKHDSPWLLRPPGARQTDFLSACIRCGACVKVCPTSGLQPGTAGLGLESVLAPALMPRLGFCDYSCNACGQTCPTGAIPPLALEDKRRQVIGVAYIDKNRCLPWSENRNCIVCEEMCPVSPKAVVLDEDPVVNDQGESVIVKRPRVLRESCIGCGICEYQCPLNGPAAIRIYTANQFTAKEV